jgi:hypothetical protein
MEKLLFEISSGFLFCLLRIQLFAVKKASEGIVFMLFIYW